MIDRLFAVAIGAPMPSAAPAVGTTIILLFEAGTLRTTVATIAGMRAVDSTS